MIGKLKTMDASEIAALNQIINKVAIVSKTDLEGNITFINDQFVKWSKYEPEEIIGQTHRILKSGYHDDKIYKELWQTISSGKIWQGELKNRAKDGTYYWVDAIIAPILGNDNKPKGYIAQRFVINDKKEKEQIMLKLLKDYEAKNEELEKNIQKMNLALQMIEEKNTQLTKVHKELNQFLYSASHDLKAPLMSHLGLINILRWEKAEKEICLNRMELNIRKLESHLRDIVNYTKSKHYESYVERINLSEMINDTVNLMKYDKESSDVSIQIQISENEPLWSDPFRLRIILFSIISNAFIYQDPDKEERNITIMVNINSKKAVITVKDNGMGIEKAYLDKIFDLFFRASELSKGSGLGLFLVKESLEKLNGTIEVFSEPGNGSIFQVVVPNFPIQKDIA